VKFGASLAADLEKLSSKRGCSQFMTALAGFKVLLGQLTGKDDIVVGINVAQRLPANGRNLIAFTVNPLAIRSKSSPEMRFSDYLEAVKDRVFGAYEHQNVTVTTLNKKSGIRRDPKKWNVVPVAFNFDRSGRAPKFHGLQVAAETNALDSGRLDLYIDVTEKNGSLLIECDYNSDLFDEATVRSWLLHYQTLLEAIVKDPEQTVAALPKLHRPEEKTGPQVDQALELELTKYQKLIWAGQKMRPDAPMYINAGYGIVSAAIDREHYLTAIRAFIKNCDALRIVIADEDGVPRQKILPDFAYEPEYLDFSLETDPRGKLDDWARQRCRTPLNMNERMFDIALVKLADTEYAVYANTHHIISDAWSVTLMSALIGEYYQLSLEGRLDDVEKPPQFRDFVEQQLASAESPRALKAEEYWKEKLAEEIEPLRFYGKTPVRRTTRVERISLELGVERSRKLKEIARRADVFVMSDDASLQHVFAAIVMTYLSHISGGRRISIGVPFHNRKSGRKTIGLLMQILPLRVSLEEGDSFISLISKISGEYFKILRYNEYQIGNPLQRQAYDVEFNFINAKNPGTFNGVPVKHRWLHPGHAADNLAIQIYDNLSGGFTCEFDFHCDVFDEEERPLAVNHFLQVVDALCEKAERTVDSVSLASIDERNRILVEFNSAEAPFPLDKTFAQLFERQAQRSPDSLAASDDRQSLTYAELNRKSNRLAHHLIELGVGPEAIVGLFSRRGVDFLTAILAVFKAGGAYMPLDPEHPPERVAGVLTRSACRLVLTTEEFWPKISRVLEQTPLDEQPLVLKLEDLIEREGAEDDPPPRSWPASLSYVIYTSGSTGSPKGAMVEQAGMINHLHIKVSDLPITDSDVVAQSASQCSDVSVWQFLSALLVGGRVHIVDDQIVKDPMEQLAMVDREGVTILEIVPSQLRAMVEGMAILGEARPDLSALKLLIVNGEALTPDICRRWRELYPDTPLMNAYGPTECSDDVTHYLLRQPPEMDKTRVPIGRPLANLRLYALDRKSSLAPIGVAGELNIGGAGVGRGYLKDPERTAQSFLPDPFTDKADARRYKTGDLGRYLPDGNLEFISRVDHQVKIRGFRVELGEVESALCNHPAVAQAVVTVREETPGDKRLVAYIIASHEQRPTATELRSFLKEKLPDYMTPATFVLLDSLPLLPNGKVNQKALPAPDSSRPELECEFTAPRNEIERKLADIWAEVLGLERVGAHDNFFDLGGDSIMIVLIAAKANQAGLRLMPMQIFERQTIAELAEVAGATAAVNAEQGEVTGPVPLTPVQRWFFEQDVANVHYYNQAIMLELREPVDPSLMEKVIERLIFHHDALRLRFKNSDGEWIQFHDPVKAGAPYAKVDLTSLNDQDQRQAIEAKAAELQASLNLFDGPVFRVALFDLGADKANRLFIAAHHLVIDGVSWRILLTDLQIAYEQLKRGEEISLSPKTTSFKQWAERLAERSRSTELRQEASYWLGVASEPVGRLPLDFDGAENTRESADIVTVSLDEEQTKALLQDVVKTYDAQINDLLLSALARALSQWTGAQSHLIKLEGHGREPLFDDLDTSRTVGWFTAMFPALLDVGENRSPLDALKSVKGQLRETPNRGIGYGLLCHMGADAELKERLGALPQVEVEFNYLGQVDQMISEASLFRPARESGGPSAIARGARDCMIDIGAIVINKRLQVDWVYSRNLHSRSTVERLAERYLEELRLFIAHNQALQDGGPRPEADEFNWSAEDLDEIASALNKPMAGANHA
jgi:amino acid adenylation domain-containing protein/non-ribosomal peptide synthase protein (TIGR01720 family)